MMSAVENSYRWTNEIEEAAFRAIFMARIWDAIHELEALQRTAVCMDIVDWNATAAKKQVYELMDKLTERFGK